MSEKDIVRNLILDKKKEFSESQRAKWSEEICSRISELPAFKDAGTVLIYYHLPDEVSLAPLLENYKEKKVFLLPVVCGDHLIIRKYSGEDRLKPGPFGIPEPTVADFNELDKIDLIITPGLAFDKKKNRLGRGKGYYDKFLANINALKIGVCFNFQLLDKIPTNDFDIPMDLVITPEQCH